jgi:hypothetical protein
MCVKNLKCIETDLWLMDESGVEQPAWRHEDGTSIGEFLRKDETKMQFYLI